jgi:hypothetical protein
VVFVQVDVPEQAADALETKNTNNKIIAIILIFIEYDQ